MESGCARVRDRSTARPEIINRRQKRGLSRATFATRRSSYIRCCELRRAGRTVGERLGMCPPSMRDDGFGMALKEGARWGSGVKPRGSSNNCERGTTAARLEACEASRRSIRITRRGNCARLVGGSSVGMTSVPRRVCRYGMREVRRSRAGTVCVGVRREMTGRTMGHVRPSQAGKRGGEPDTPHANENSRPK
jgi:hypothetical protein